MQKYKIYGDHPVLKRIDWEAVGLDDMNKKVNELQNAGYEVKIIPDGFVEDDRKDMSFF